MRLSEVSTQARENNLNLIRLIAAIAVLFAHSFALLDGEQKRIWNDSVSSGLFSFIALAVFFGLSGFLITQSFDRRRTWFQFLEARWLRIFPGLFFSCLFTVVLVSQFVKYQGLSAFTDILNWRQAFGAFFFDYAYFNGVFDGNPNKGVNGSLWTLPVEFRMYLFVFACGISGLLTRRDCFLLFALLLLAGGAIPIEFVTQKIFPLLFRIKNYSFEYYSLPFSFVCGMLAYLFREKIELRLRYAGALILLAVLLGHWSLVALSGLYGALTFGYLPSLYLPALNFRTDLSYGIYVLAYPIQQTLIFHGVRPEPHLFFLLSLAATIPPALISWHFFEKPALALKGRAFSLWRKHDTQSSS